MILKTERKTLTTLDWVHYKKIGLGRRTISPPNPQFSPPNSMGDENGFVASSTFECRSPNFGRRNSISTRNTDSTTAKIGSWRSFLGDVTWFRRPYTILGRKEFCGPCAYWAAVSCFVAQRGGDENFCRP